MNKLNVVVKRLKELEAENIELKRVVRLLMRDEMGFGFRDEGDEGWTAYNAKTKERYYNVPDEDEAMRLAGLGEGDWVGSVKMNEDPNEGDGNGAKV